MAMVINTNVMSLNAQRNLSASQSAQNQAMERLSSGKRINSAADDAAGMQIASGLTSQVNGLNQAVRNANDGISLVQTAEGALQESTNILQRMRELSIQSANGIFTDGNRDALNAEVGQLKAELTRIADTTTFNGLNILDGSLGSFDLQVGSEANQTIGVDFAQQSFDANSLGSNSGDIVGEETTGLAALTAMGVTASSTAMTINDQTVSVLTGAANLQEALSTLNNDIADFGAEASALVTGVLSGATKDLTLALVDDVGNTTSYVITDTNNMDELVAKINNDTGGKIEATLEDGRLVLVAENATSLTATDGSTDNGATGLTNAQEALTYDFALVLTDTSAEGKGVKVEYEANATATTIQNLGIDGMEIGKITGTTAALASADAIQEINKLAAETGVVASAVNTTTMRLTSTTGGEISIKYSDTATATDATMLAVTGLQERNASGGGGSIASVNISTAAGAQKAIDTIDSALETINNARGEMGAITNRLDFTVSNLSNVSQNASASRSRIEDADFAAESAALSRSQVLQQAGMSMLAQANAAPQQVLSLLQ